MTVLQISGQCGVQSGRDAPCDSFQHVVLALLLSPNRYQRGSERLSLIKMSLNANIALTETSCLLLPGRMCDASSYKPWSPGVSETKNDTCLLGEQEVIERKNPNVFCFNGREYERVTDTKICKCVHADYEW